MKSRNTALLALAAILLSGAFFGASAQSADPDPMRESLLKVYSELLDEDPRDPDVLFRRAELYYSKNDYLRAFEDVDRALVNAEDPDLRFRCLQLRAGVLMMQEKYQPAIADLNEILTLSPQNFGALYERGTALYGLGRYSEAKADFRLMQQIDPRSQEALFGLARVAVKENNLGLASELCDKAVEITPSRSDVYMRRASVRTLMNDEKGAVDDYLLAIATDETSTSRALYELVNVSRSNYPVVIAGLSGAIRQAPRNGLYYYMRAMIAQGHSNYKAAIADYDKIINDNLDSYAGLNASLAECYYALGKYDTAMLNIDYAISATDQNQDYWALKSRIQHAVGDYEGALSSAEKSLAKDPDYNDALIAKAMAQLSLGNASDASVSLGEAAMNDPRNPMVFNLRGWILDDFRGQKANARRAYERLLDVDYPADNARSLRGFALLKLDRRAEADSWMKNVLETSNDYDGEVNYLAACYYAQAGDTDAALRCMASSLDKGYANYHNWKDNVDAGVNVAPLRSDPRFQALLNDHESLFK